MNLSKDLLPIENIILDLDVNSKKRVFEEVAALFERNNSINKEEIFQCLLSREKLGSTGLGCGVAIPHGRVSSIEKAIAAFVRLKNPIEFNSQDEKPVSLIFVMLVPDGSNTEHLKILSHLAQKFSNKTIRDKLKESSSAEEIAQILLEN